ncbi:MAG: IclR family transcriptional regulator [Armatimonadota bacterium]|nr:IclR family transcriptional regulator [Armatimonadota bacterium]MDR5696394.1 IclR family transcriptional regulator [Armatimonadota bacterium]
MRGAQLLERALKILDMFTPERPAWLVSEISHATGLSRPTVYRILRALQVYGYVRRDPVTSRFRLGSGALALGRRALESIELRQVAYPVMRRLQEATGETVLLTVVSEDGTESVCVERLESPQRLRLILEVGRRVPLHAGASSKVLLAFMRPEQVRRVVALRGLPRLNKNTITEPDALEQELAEIRRRGYALSFEETNQGAAGIAAPVFDVAGQLAGGLGIAGPLIRFGDEALTHLIPLVCRHADEITRALGGQRAATPLGASR